MARARRTRFAASFVVVAACGHAKETGGGGGGTATGTGGGPRKPVTTWSINAMGDRCSVYEWNDCPPDVHCNPPPPIEIACPPGEKTDGTARIVSFDGKTCELEDTHAPIACPSYDTPPPSPPDAATTAVALRSWSITRTDKTHCEYWDDPCSKMHLKPGEPIPPCNPPPPIEIACPSAMPPAPSNATIVEESAGACFLMPAHAKMDCPK